MSLKVNEYLGIRSHLGSILEDTPFKNHVYCVGGCVRDYLRGVGPKDIDLVIDLPGGGIELAKYLWESGYLLYSPVVYQNFGTTSFRLREFPDHELEAVQTRSEEYINRESRNPKTGFGNLEEDWGRRDFTVNALYHSLWEETIFDPSHKGVEDINSGVIRTTSDPEIIFYDDPLRILRAIRFSVTLGYQIFHDCLEGMRKNFWRLEIISKERIVSEVTKILCSQNPKGGMKLLGDIGALSFLSSDLEACRSLGQNVYHLGTVWEHTLEVLDKLKGADEITLWAGLFHDVGKVRTKTVGEDGRIHFLGHSKVGGEMTRDILRSLHFPAKITDDIVTLISRHMDYKGSDTPFPRPKDKKLRRLQYDLGRENYHRLWNLIEADNLSHAPGYCIEGQREYVLSRPQDMFDYQLPISGRDIMEVRGLKKSDRIVGRYKEHLLKLACHNPELTREDMLKLLKNLSPGELGKNKS